MVLGYYTKSKVTAKLWKVYYILCSVFIIISSMIYTFERFISYYSMIGERMSFSQVGNGMINLVLPNLSTNIFVPLFILMGVLLYIFGYIKK